MLRSVLNSEQIAWGDPKNSADPACNVLINRLKPIAPKLGDRHLGDVRLLRELSATDLLLCHQLVKPADDLWGRHGLLMAGTTLAPYDRMSRHVAIMRSYG